MSFSNPARVLPFKLIAPRVSIRPKVNVNGTPVNLCRKSLHTLSHSAACNTRSALPRPRSSHGFDFRLLKPSGARSIFIQTENTPNSNALKFLPNHTVLPKEIAASFLEYLTPRSTLAPPHPSPLAAQLFNVDGITSIFYGSDYITVTKATDNDWAHVKPEVFSLITEAVNSGEQIVNTVQNSSLEAGQEGGDYDTLAYNESDSEVVGMIKELLESRIRPSIQEDGGDIEFRGFEGGNVLLKLRGACRTCSSSTVTLKNGIERMLMHYIEEVKGVIQVLDQEEQIAMQEFTKFEERLKRQRGPKAVTPTADNGGLDAIDA